MYLVNLRVPGGIRNLSTLYAAPLRQTSTLVNLRAFNPTSRQCKLSFAAQAAVLDGLKKREPRQTGFESLGLGEELLAAVAEHRLEAPTEIQVIGCRTMELMQEVLDLHPHWHQR